MSSRSRGLTWCASQGEHKLATLTWLIAGEHSLQVEAFFCRQPDENHAAFYRFLLERNARMYGVHFALDRTGDVYLTGRLPLSATSEAEIDTLLGCVLTYSDETFNEALRIGFASAIRREWAWREKRGESLANLRPFADLANPPSNGTSRRRARRDHPGRGQHPRAPAPAYHRGAHAALRPVRAAHRREATPAPRCCSARRRPRCRPSASMHVSLIADLIRRRVWLAGIGMVIVAAVAQAAALATGPIALVQPIFIIELPVTLVLAALANHNRAALQQLPWAAIALTTAALGGGLAVAQPSGAIDSAQDTSWVIALIATALLRGGADHRGHRHQGRAAGGAARPAPPPAATR